MLLIDIKFLRLVMSFTVPVSDSVSCEISEHLKLLKREAPEHLDKVCMKNRQNLISTWNAGASSCVRLPFLES